MNNIQSTQSQSEPIHQEKKPDNKAISNVTQKRSSLDKKSQFLEQSNIASPRLIVTYSRTLNSLKEMSHKATIAPIATLQVMRRRYRLIVIRPV